MTGNSNMAAIVKAIFTRERVKYAKRKGDTRGWSSSARWDGGTTRDGRNCQPVWPKLVDFMLKYEFNPEEYLSIAFNNWSSRHAPSPESIMGDVVKRDFVKYYENIERITKQELDNQNDCAAMQLEIDTITAEGMTSADIVRSAICSKSLRLSMLFRYCWAVAEGHMDIAEELEPAALTQYYYKRSIYDKVWEDKIPDKLKKEADRLLPV